MDEGGDVTFTPTLSGGAPDTYKWTATNGTIKGSDTGSTVVVTAGTAGDCSAELTVTNKAGSDTGTGKVAVQALPLNIISQPANQTITEGEDLDLSATVDDDEGISWQWKKDNSDISGATGSGSTATYNKSPSEVSDAGDYTVTFTRASDSSEVTSNTATVTVNALPPISISMLPPPAVTAGSDITVSASVSGGKTPYSWKWELVNPGTGMTIEDDTAEDGCTIKTTSESVDASSCEIKLTITDANADTGTDSKPVTVNA